MNHVWKTRLVIFVLLFAGTGLTALRSCHRHNRPLPPWESVWKLHLEAGFTAPEKGTTIRLPAPKSTSGLRVYKESFYHPNLRLENVNGAEGGRELIGRAFEPGESLFSAEFDVHLSPEKNFPDRFSNGELAALQRARYLKETADFPVSAPAVTRKLSELSAGDIPRKDLVGKIFEFCHKEIVSGSMSDIDSAVLAIQSRKASMTGCARAMVTLCRAARFPARLVVGFEIKSAPYYPAPIYWVEVHTYNTWVSYDPTNGYAGEIPAEFLPVRRDGGHEIFRVDGVKPSDLNLSYRIEPTSAPSEVRATRKAGFADIFELTRLPLGVQKTLELVLLLPLGALVTALFRNIIGVMTFGTFGPTLLALAFIFADWKTGIVMAVVILLVGLLVRHLIDPLRLLLVPRLGVILTMVVVSTIMAVSVTDYLGWTTEGQSVLLPMVILTGLIERIFTTVEEEGTGPTAKRVGGTLVVGFCCFLLLSSKTTGHLILVYPELHFFTVAAMVWTGRYAGYRLSELLRFADLGEKMTPPGERR